MFPILGGRFYSDRVGDIPWDVIAPHEPQALRNHTQTLKRLAERGGLTPCEAVAVLEDRVWRWMSRAAAERRLRELADFQLADRR